MASRAWIKLSDSELLKVRICDLGLRFEDCAVAPRFQKLLEEIRAAGLRFRPYAWLSTDWFTPDYCTGFAVPFYLAHSRLVRLERSQMLDVEGGSKSECMKIMRHEAAHALDNAYRLRRRKDWREAFGRSSQAYDSSYVPDPKSRKHVLNLDFWYSQSHPLEDWAETFAVWLRPASHWRTRYADWPALKKLRYVDELMGEIASKPPPNRTRSKEEPLSSVKTTLAEHYRRKRKVYTDEGSPALNGQLTRVFTPYTRGPRNNMAAAFLRKHRAELVRRVSSATGQHRYLLDHVVRDMVESCHSNDLQLRTTPADGLVSAAIMLTSFSSQYLYGAHPIYHR